MAEFSEKSSDLRRFSFISPLAQVFSIGAIFSTVVVFFTNLHNQIMVADERVSKLEKQLGDLQTDFASKIRNSVGPQLKGDAGRQGERGPAGPPGSTGPQGEPGPPGPSIPASDLSKLIDQRISIRISSVNSINSRLFATSQPSLLTSCIPTSSLHTNSVLLVDGKSEFCSDDGALIGRILKIDAGGEGAVLVKDVKNGQSGFCSYGAPCSWKFLNGAIFTVEKVLNRDDKNIAQLRFRIPD